MIIKTKYNIGDLCYYLAFVTEEDRPIKRIKVIQVKIIDVTVKCTESSNTVAYTVAYTVKHTGYVTLHTDVSEDRLFPSKQDLLNSL